MKIRVPATSANLGPGFDSCGIALSQYLTIEIGPETRNWQINHQLGSKIPSDERNLLIKTALDLAPNLKPHQLTMISDIPIARGLGSSSSVVVAGIELANRLGNLGMTPQQKVAYATKVEGHPDNVAPAICGDFVVASYNNNESHRQHLVPHLKKIRTFCKTYGGYGSFLSGAGPTVLVLTPPEKTEKLAAVLQDFDPEASIDVLSIEREGVQIF